MTYGPLSAVNRRLSPPALASKFASKAPGGDLTSMRCANAESGANSRFGNQSAPARSDRWQLPATHKAVDEAKKPLAVWLYKPSGTVLICIMPSTVASDICVVMAKKGNAIEYWVAAT